MTLLKLNENITEEDTPSEILIWKRLHRFGRVCSKDLELLLNITNVHASRLLKSFFDKNSNKVYKEGRFIYLYPNTIIPEFITNKSLLDNLIFSNQPGVTGILDTELPIIINQKNNDSPFFNEIFEAIKNTNKIQVFHINLDVVIQEKTKPITLVPVSFTLIDGIMFLIAVNLDNNNKVELFNLKNITHVKTLTKIHILKNIEVFKEVELNLTFNDFINDEQKEIIINQFDLKLNDNNEYIKTLYEYEVDYFVFKNITNLKHSYFKDYKTMNVCEKLNKEKLNIFIKELIKERIKAEVLTAKKLKKEKNKEEKVTLFTEQLKELIKDNPNINQLEIAQKLNLTKQAISLKLKNYGINLQELKNNNN